MLHVLTSRRALMGGLRTSLWCPGRTSPLAPCSCASTTRRRSPKTNPGREDRCRGATCQYQCGTRPEVIAARKAELERAQASVVLAQKTYDRVSQLAEHGNAPIARLDQATDSLHEAQRNVDQAKSAYEQAVNGYTKEEHEIAEANVKKAVADIAAVQSIVDQMVVYAPVASQVYQRNVEPGEYVSPGVPLVTLIDLHDMWIHFDLREDLVRTLKVGDRFDVRIPALADRRITVEVKLIATKGEYASWRATRATGDFDLRTFSIRAYPVDKVPELRPGMSAYLDWRER